MMVLLDTNFIMLPEQFKIDIIQEIKKIAPSAEITTLQSVIAELKSLNLNAAKIGLAIINQEKIKVIKSEGAADDALLDAAIKNSAIIATNDKPLKDRALKNNIKVMFMRNKKKVEITGGELLV